METLADYLQDIKNEVEQYTLKLSSLKEQHNNEERRHAEVIKRQEVELLEKIKKEENKLKRLEESLRGIEETMMGKITLNVGGCLFTTSKTTLTKEKDSFLACLCSNRWDPEEDGSYFIDREPALFSHVLGYLRTGFVFTSLSKEKKKALLCEADFYGLPGLKRAIHMKEMPYTSSEDIREFPYQNALKMWQAVAQKYVEKHTEEYKMDIEEGLYNGFDRLTITINKNKKEDYKCNTLTWKGRTPLRSSEHVHITFAPNEYPLLFGGLGTEMLVGELKRRWECSKISFRVDAHRVTLHMMWGSSKWAEAEF